MAATNSLGAEQTLCRAFHSVVCFSRAETLAYANFSFAGETLYRLYRLSLLAIETRQNLEIKTRPEITGLGLGTWTVNLRRDVQVLPAVSTQPSAVTHPRRRRAAPARQVAYIPLRYTTLLRVWLIRDSAYRPLSALGT